MTADFCWFAISGFFFLRSEARLISTPPLPCRGQILGRNPDKSLKDFPSCYSQ
jgi:hypothetical protein